MNKVVVSVADDHLDRVADVVTRLGAAGMVIDDVQPTIGTVTGSIDAGALGALECVEGVGEVERQRGYRLPPPDAEVQ